MPRLLLILLIACPLTTAAGPVLRRVHSAAPEVAALAQLQRLEIPSEPTRHFRLKKGQTIEISLRIEQPSRLPVDGRLRASWELVQADQPADIPRAGNEDPPARPLDALGIYTSPTANWSKLLHALDADVTVNYRVPATGIYRVGVAPHEDPVDLFRPADRWREPGNAPAIVPPPSQIAWPADATAEVSLSVTPFEPGDSQAARMFIELEPNDTPEQAQPITLLETVEEYTLNIIGSSDDIEYFDNGDVGQGGDDWFRIELPTSQPRLLTACLSIPDLQVVARIRAYRVDPARIDDFREIPSPGSLIPLVEYQEGKNENERVHQQIEQHRIAINRTMQPGDIYFLRVEANAPAYDLELRVVRPAPYDDPRRAVVQGLYDHLGQVDAWISNRPRGASVERRIRDTGNLLGTNCMSCHTQSGVWGPAIPFAQGYRPQNIQLWRHLINTCYQSLRPTNHLKDAVNNTSLQPLDLGDGPAGTRVAGHAVVSLERFLPARQLQSKVSTRSANFVLQSGDPEGINAAGPGANVGQSVVLNYAGEILAAAWQTTGEVRYFHALQDKARKMLDITPKFCDDLGHRIEFFSRYFPADYVATVGKVAAGQELDTEATAAAIQAAEQLQGRIETQLRDDLARLKGIQLEGGGWSFDPGTTSDGGKTWTVQDQTADPSPTALSLIAMESMGIGADDPSVARGLEALLQLQHPTGYWKVQSLTGFVSTAYALHAISRYFPATPPHYEDHQFDPQQGETLVAAIRRLRDASVSEEPRFLPVFLQAVKHESPLVRYWAMIGLGALHTEPGVEGLIRGLADRTKMVREAAHWAMRQTLIDDHGWQPLLAALQSDDDYLRESAMRALVMKVDSVLPATELDHAALTAALDAGLNEDPHPAVRAWATRAAWQWWIWNPPLRGRMNLAWTRLLERPEDNSLTENAIRYQTHALFIANGHIANGSPDHQYQELGELFTLLQQRLVETRDHDQVTYTRLVDRLAAVAATYYNQRGGDGGPGQMGYLTPGAATLFGTAILARLEAVENLAQGQRRTTLLKSVLEGAANIPVEKLQEKLVDYSVNGPEKLRGLAASSLSDQRLVSLTAVPEQLEPMVAQLQRGAREPPRRAELSDPILKMFARVGWILPETDEQRQQILRYLVPETDQYLTPAALQAMENVAARQIASRNSEASWYLADGLGAAVAKNPDLHFEHLARIFPLEFGTAAEASFWLRSVPWILEFQTTLPELKLDPKSLPPIDPYEELRTRALSLFLGQLEEQADPRNRQEATTLANQTALRRNPEVLTALETMLTFEERKPVVEIARKVLSQRNDSFLEELVAAVEKVDGYTFPDGVGGDSQLPADFIKDVHYFRDYVVPEMTKVLRGDERSCMIYHGQPGRVPSMELHAPDQVGFLPVDQLLANYRILQHRVNVEQVLISKLLRKPLNVQSGEEDGHQGGRRYQVDDPGYKIIRSWVENQVGIQERYGLPRKSMK